MFGYEISDIFLSTSLRIFSILSLEYFSRLITLIDTTVEFMSTHSSLSNERAINRTNSIHEEVHRILGPTDILLFLTLLTCEPRSYVLSSWVGIIILLKPLFIASIKANPNITLT
jgi:hypothetical protein